MRVLPKTFSAPAGPSIIKPRFAADRDDDTQPEIDDAFTPREQPEIEPQYAAMVEEVNTLTGKQDYAGAVPILTRLLAAYEQDPLLGAEHSRTLNLVDALAAVYQHLDAPDRAEPFLRRKLVWLETPGKAEQRDPLGTAIIPVRSALISVLRKQGKYAEAQAYLERSLAEFKMKMGPRYDDPNGNHEPAFDDDTDLHAMMRHTMEGVSAGHTLNQLGEVLAAQGQSAPAEAHYRKALDFFSGNRNAVPVYENLLKLPQIQDNPESRLSILEALCTIESYSFKEDASSYYNDNPALAKQVVELAQLHLSQGNPDKAAEWYGMGLRMFHYMVSRARREELKPDLLKAYDFMAQHDPDEGKRKTWRIFAHPLRAELASK
jgi:tetratricopeptide (TPR) repeat protein